MAISMNAENSDACSSPRISFSNDLPEANTLEKQEEVEVMGLDKSVLLESNSEFNFCATSSPGKETYCPADELFFNGMIIPTQMKQKLNSINGHSKDEKEEVEITGLTTATLIREEKTQSNSVWGFKRSCSLNCENYIYGRKKSSIWSLPLLFRSKSTGFSSVKCSEDESQHSQKNSKFSGNPSRRLMCSSHQKPPLKKSGSNGSSASAFAGSYPTNNGVSRNSHILNVPSPYIAKATSDLLGFSSLFGYGSMDKKSKK